jgi:CPA1 family monovalent cation:H+ antiporter
MALSLPTGQHRGIIIAMTDGVVVFSSLVQGVTIGRVVKRVVTRVERDTAFKIAS